MHEHLWNVGAGGRTHGAGISDFPEDPRRNTAGTPEGEEGGRGSCGREAEGGDEGLPVADHRLVTEAL